MSRPIGYFQSQEIVKQRYKQIHGGSANTAKARSIALHVEQGVNFIESAARAPVSIRPLAQFYGVTALARAATLFLKPEAAENTLTGGHGLEMVDWGVLGEGQDGRGFAKLNLRTTRGLFTDLNSATDGLVRFHANSSKPNWSINLGDVAQGVTVNFADVLGLLPDLWSAHEVWTDKKKTRFALQGLKLETKDNKDQHIVTVGTSETPQLCEALFPDGVIQSKQLDDHTVQLIVKKDMHFQPVQLHRGAFDIGDTLLTPPINSSQAFSTIAIYYMVAYTMSMLARYRLSDWLAIWRGEKGDSIRPLFEQAMQLIEDEYPQLCAELMNGD